VRCSFHGAYETTFPLWLSFFLANEKVQVTTNGHLLFANYVPQPRFGSNMAGEISPSGGALLPGVGSIAQRPAGVP
jgi:hypothetical protein